MPSANDRSGLRHLDLWRFGHVRKLDVGQLDLRRLDLRNHRRRRQLDLNLGWRWRLFLLERNRLVKMGQLNSIIDGLLCRCANHNGANCKQNVQRDGGEQRTLALVTVIQYAEVSELHTLRVGIISAKRLCHKESL